MACESRRYSMGSTRPPPTSFPRLVAYRVPQPCNLDGISMNIQEENSAHYFRVLAYVSPLGECVLNQRMQLAQPTLGYTHKKSCAYHHVLKSIESLDGDRGMDRCQYAVPFKGILIRSMPEIVLSSKRN